MPLPVLVLLVVGGIAAIVIAVHFTGGSRKTPVGSVDEAAKRFAEDYPDDTVLDGVITADGETAFLRLASGKTGIVHTVGDRYLTRKLHRGDGVIVSVFGEAGMDMHLPDLTWRGGQFTFSGQADRDAVLRLLTMVQGAE